MSHHKKKEHHIRVYKLLAQTVGLVTCLFFILFIIGEGVPDIAKGSGKDLLPFLPFILLPIAGFIITWFKEQLGMILLITGGLALLIYFIVKADIKMAMVYSIPFLITGILFQIHITKRNNLKKLKV
jgi:predicted membrane protein